MSYFILDVISTFVSLFVQVSIWEKIASINIEKRNIYFIIEMILLSICIVLIHEYGNNFIKGFLVVVLLIVFCKNIFRITLRKSILLTFLTELIIIISESIIYIFMTLVLKVDANIISNSTFLTISIDIIISLFSLLISKISFIKKLYNFFLRITLRINVKQVTLLVLFVAIGTNIFTTTIYFKNNVLLSLILNSIIAIIYTIIVIYSFNYQNKYYKTNFKYQTSIKDLKTREKLIDEYRIINHENKNQLLTIKSMTKNKKILNYINSLINNRDSMINSTIITSLRIPQGGIRGLVYSKLNNIEEKQIKYYVHVDKKISANHNFYVNDDDAVDICTIIGVFIDNAIDACENLNNKIINLDFYLKNNQFVIDISNNYQGEIKNNNMELKTSKGDGRGYGLQLVKKTLEKNQKLYNERMITKDLFTQKLFYKMDTK